MANPELGAKQLCPTCSAKFYDLGRRPAVCPKCHTAFDPEEVVKVRRTRTRSTVADYEDDEAPKPDVEKDGFEDEVDETPEIDQGIDDVVEGDDEDADGAGKSAPSDDLGVDFAEDEDAASEDDADVPFLEDEDEDDAFNEDDIEGLPGEDDRD